MNRTARQLLSAVVLSAIAFPFVASAQAIQKWKTPDGKLFFGEKPPAGSVPLGKIGSIGSASSPEMTSQPTPEPQPEPRTEEKRPAPKVDPDAPRLVVSAVSNSGRGEYLGLVQNVGSIPAHHVEACIADTEDCFPVSPSLLAPGESGSFRMTLAGRFADVQSVRMVARGVRK